MMPPVSLPLKREIQSARPGADTSIPGRTSKVAATILRIADSIPAGGILRGLPSQKKGARPSRNDLRGECCRVALDPVGASRHRPRTERCESGGLHMRDVATCLKRFDLVRLGLVAALAVLASGRPAQA